MREPDAERHGDQHVERRELQALLERAAHRRVVPAPTGSGRPSTTAHEKPCQTLRERPSLNENSIAITTGTIAQTMYSHVTTTSARGCPHGIREPVADARHSAAAEP